MKVDPGTLLVASDAAMTCGMKRAWEVIAADEVDCVDVDFHFYEDGSIKAIQPEMAVPFRRAAKR